jgi:hypothetical protein
MTTEVIQRLRDAQSLHDLDAFVACFDPRYRSEQPVHPRRAFVGSRQVRSNWAEVFAGVPDFHAELLRSARQGDIGWAEWHWRGTRTDGTRLDMRGVTTVAGWRADLQPGTVPAARVASAPSRDASKEPGWRRGGRRS